MAKLAKDPDDTTPQTPDSAVSAVPAAGAVGEAGVLASALIEAMRSVQTQPGITKSDLAEVLKDNTEGMRRALKPENAKHPDVSVFNPQGERDHPRPRLTRKTFWAGQELHREDLDTDEIELLNSFDHTKEARNGTWRAEIRTTGAKGTEELHISFPCRSMDDRMDLPNGMKVMLRELHGGSSAVDPATMAERILALERQLSKT